MLNARAEHSSVEATPNRLRPASTRATYAGFAPVVFCVVFRRPDALACMRTACFELFRLALSRNRRAFQILLATLAAVDLPSPESRVDLRCVFVDSAKTPEQRAPLRDMVVPSSGVARAGLRSLDDKDADGYCGGDAFRRAFAETQMFAVYVQRIVEVHLRADTAVSPAADGPALSELLDAREAHAKPCVAVVARVPLLDGAAAMARPPPDASEGPARWRRGPPAARRRGAARGARGRRAAGAATDARSSAEFYRRTSLVRVAGDRRRRRAGPFGAASEVFAMYFVCVPRLLRRRDDHAMAAALLRALGLLFHLLRSHLVPDEVEWRGLLLAAGQLRFLATSAECRTFARKVAAALFETMRDLRVLPGQITFSLFALAASGNDPARGLEAPDLFARNASASRSDSAAPRRLTFAGPDGVEEDHPLAWLELSGVRFCAERKVDTAFLGRVDDLADEDGRLFSAGDALFGSYKRRRRSATLHRAAALDDGDARRRLATRGERSLGADALRREVPHLYYGALWYAARLRLPIIFRATAPLLLLLAAPGGRRAAALAAPGPPEPEGARVEAADPGADAGAPPPPPPETEGGDAAAPPPGLASGRRAEVEVVRKRLKRSSGGVLDPNGDYMARWDIITTLFLLFTAIVTPVEVGFTRQLGGPPEQWAIWWINRLVDLVFIKDIGVQFFLPYQDRTRGNLVTSMALSYAKISMYGFAVGIVFVSHWMACLWGLVDVMAEKDAWTWVKALEASKADPRGRGGDGRPTFRRSSMPHRYAAALYFSVYTLTSIGYGDITATNPTECVVASCLIFFGSFFWAYTIGSFCATLATMDIYEVQWKQTMDEMNEMMHDRNFDMELRRRCRMFMKNAKHLAKAANYRQLEQQMSLTLRSTAAVANNQTWLANCWFLSPPTLTELSPTFVAHTSQALTIHLFAPLELVEVPVSLCILNSGIVARSGKPMGKGQVWGLDFVLREEHAYALDRSYGSSLTYAEVVTLEQTDFFEILDNGDYPEEHRAVKCAQVFYRVKAALLRHVAEYVNAKREGRKVRRRSFEPEENDETLDEDADDDAGSPRLRDAIPAMGDVSETRVEAVVATRENDDALAKRIAAEVRAAVADDIDARLRRHSPRDGPAERRPSVVFGSRQSVAFQQAASRHTVAKPVYMRNGRSTTAGRP
ncbi:voltage-gated potassium channel [Aureococcus anophagefferens]|nr:voltage-gated potassium channel [Aureococcus anophagefferens]